MEVDSSLQEEVKNDGHQKTHRKVVFDNFP